MTKESKISISIEEVDSMELNSVSWGWVAGTLVVVGVGLALT